MADFLIWLQHTWLATSVNDSLTLTALTSATHVVGFALLTGSVIVATLRLTGLAFTEVAASEIAATTRRGTFAGLSISVFTGALLFSTRATMVGTNSTFRIKMALLVAATLFQVLVSRRLVQRGAGPRVLQATGVVGLALWLGVGAAACAFILLE